MSSTLARVTAGEGLTPLTDRANQAKETAFLRRRPQGGEDPEQIFQKLPRRGRHLAPIATNRGKAPEHTAKPAWDPESCRLHTAWCK